MRPTSRTTELISNLHGQIRDPLSKERIFRTPKKGNRICRIMRRLIVMLCNKLRRMRLRAHRKAKATSEAVKTKRTSQTASSTLGSRSRAPGKATKLRFTRSRRSIVMRTTTRPTTLMITTTCSVAAPTQMMIMSRPFRRTSRVTRMSRLCLESRKSMYRAHRAESN